MAANRVIGNNGQIPWMGQFPEDMKHFKETTRNHAVVMGRSTWESIGAKKLPNRYNIVTTRKMAVVLGADYTADSLEDALNECRVEGRSTVFVIGGAELYREALPVADEVILTVIDRDYPGDVFFPKIDQAKFSCWAVEDESRNEHFSYRFEYWRRK